MILSMRRALFVFTAAMVAAVCHPAWYFIEARPETKQAWVVIVLEEGETASEFRMPAWAPGDYHIFDYGTKIEKVKFSLDGEEVAAKQGDDVNLWTVEGKVNMVEYLVNESRGNFSPNLRVTADEMFVSGPGVLGWFVGHADEKQSLQIMANTENAKAACSLDKVTATAESFKYSAEDYDELIDSPFVVGDNVRIHEFDVEGKLHAIVGYNKSAGVDLAQFEDVATKLAIEAKKLFGELPYDRYYYFFDFGGPSGGLEHLDSTKIGLPSNATPQQALGIMSHEYFHTFNVKRIRSKVLGPFDYTKPAITGTLWWFEGVTDYYADVLLHRAGLRNRAQFLSSMDRAVLGLARTAARLTISADDSSKRVWEDRRSSGYGGLSYYTKGKNVGLVLDLAIRAYSNNERSLDDVIVQLYKETIKGPGFGERRIRELCVEYGGEQLGPIYDTCVYQAVDVPIDAMMQLSGLAWINTRFGDNRSAPERASSIGKAWPYPLKSD